MIEVNTVLAQLNITGLDAALKSALPVGKVLGVQTYGPTRPISIWMDESTLQADRDTALTITATHDPVFLSVDKPKIKADNADITTISVSAPKPGAAAVTLLIGSNAVPVTLTNGEGSVQVTSAAPASITVSVQNPQNRTTDTLTIEAI